MHAFVVIVLVLVALSWLDEHVIEPRRARKLLEAQLADIHARHGRVIDSECIDITESKLPTITRG